MNKKLTDERIAELLKMADAYCITYAEESEDTAVALRELQIARERIAELTGQLTSLFERVSGENILAYPDGAINWLADTIEGELDASEGALKNALCRIAELEVRKFKVEMPESFYPDGDIEVPLVVNELEVIAAIVEAGGKPVAFCKRCDHELDLTHRPDGAHYCHSKG